MPNAITRGSAPGKPTRPNLQPSLIYQADVHDTPVFGDAPLYVTYRVRPFAPARILKDFKRS